MVDTRRHGVGACTALPFTIFGGSSLGFIQDQIAMIADVCFAACFSKLNI